MKLLKWIVITPLALIGLAFAVANRHETTVSLDPFGGDISTPPVPLFILLFITLLFGVILGGFVTWVSQGRNRRAARLARSEAEKWRGEADSLRTQLSATAPAVSQSRVLVRPY